MHDRSEITRNNTAARKNSSPSIRSILSGIILAGFLLRIYHLGKYSLWNDEAGQALAASQPTLSGLLDIARNHVMAMPFDYFVTRLLIGINHAEGFIRFPSVIWSTLSLYVCYKLSRRFLDEKIALLATWLLAVNPLMIFFAQEMRFYAALGFFSLFTTYLLIVGIEEGTLAPWIWLVIFSIIGAFFHPYVILSGVTGFLYTAYLWMTQKDVSHTAIRYLCAYLVIGGVFYSAVLIYKPTTSSSAALLQYNDSFLDVFAQGFGFEIINLCSNTLQWGIGETLTLFFTLLGVIGLAAHYKGKALVLFLSLPVQILAIIALDTWRNYWFVYRQIIHLIPYICILMAVGLAESYVFITRRIKGSARLPQAAFAGLLLIVSLSAIPGITYYYGVEKSNGKQIAQELILRNGEEPGSKIFVLPAYEVKVYQYYLGYYFEQPQLFSNLRSGDWDNIASTI